jgi:RNAse (barnase) inhibitor barstar
MSPQVLVNECIQFRIATASSQSLSLTIKKLAHQLKDKATKYFTTTIAEKGDSVMKNRICKSGDRFTPITQTDPIRRFKMAIKRKQISDEKAPATKHAKKKPKKTKKMKSTSSAAKNKQAIKDDGSNKSFPKSKLVSELFKNEHDFESAIGGVFELSSSHVKQLSNIVNASQIELKQALLIIYKNKGYETLGCDDFKAYVKKYLTISYDAALKQVWAARVAYVVNGLDAIGFYSDNSMLPMKDLTDEEIQDVVEHIEEENGEDITISGKYTRKIVEAAMGSLGLLDKDVSDDGLDLEVDDEVEEDADLDFDDGDDETLDSDAKAKISTKQSSKPKQSNAEEVKQSKCHRQFLKQFNIKATKSKNSKAIFDAFIKTDAGKNLKIVTKAIELLCEHSVALAKTTTTKALKKMEAQDE